jgi:phage terminase large subunit-like protein
MRREESEWYRLGYTAEWWGTLNEHQRKVFLDQLTDRQLEEFAKDWRIWARDKQIPPEGQWSTWLLLAGRAFGKTRTASEYCTDYAEQNPGARLAIVGQGDEDIRRVMIEGKSGFLAVAKSWFRPLWFPSRGGGILRWPNGSEGFVYSAMDTEGLRGPEFNLGWFDEPMAVPPEFRERAMDNLEMCLRLPPHPRLILTTTPKPHRWLHEELARAAKEEHLPIEERDYILTRGFTTENAANVAASYLKKLMKRYDGTNKGRQELWAEVLGEEAGALWTPNVLDRGRIRSGVPWAADEPSAYREKARVFGRMLERRVIGVDPNTKSSSNHAAGIIPVGERGDGVRYCLGDWSEIGKTPAEWAKTVVRCFQHFDADEIVAEVNNGGEMVRDIVYQAAADMRIDPPPVVMVHAKRDKVLRATPVSTLYQLRKAAQFGEVGHAEEPGPLYQLERQMCAIHEGYDPTGEDFDRCDGLVWAMKRLGAGDLDEEVGGSGMVSFATLAGG